MADARHLHAIMICFPFQGHINPFVNLALKLATNGITITFAHHESIHSRLARASGVAAAEFDPFSGIRESGHRLDIRYKTISDGFPVDYDRELHFEEYWSKMVDEFPPLVDEFIRRTVESDPNSAFFLVADTVYGWPAAIAEKYKFVHVALCTQPALIFLLGHYVDAVREKISSPGEAGNPDEQITYLPGEKPIKLRDLMTLFAQSNRFRRASTTAIESNKKADFILHNTVQELEAQILFALNIHQQNFAVGPLTIYTQATTNLWPETECTHWLNSKPPGSVLYVSFGSFIHSSKELMEEIAHGLILSNVNFVWALRTGILSDGDTYSLPGEFNEAKIRGKGLIIPWCNQLRILSNPAIGGFLTHNGWNSTTESMWCGVPMICCPFSYDQPLNKKLVVEDLGIGIDLGDAKSAVLRGDVAEKIRGVIHGETECYNGLREQAQIVKAAVRRASETGGSSWKNLDLFINGLKMKLGV